RNTFGLFVGGGQPFRFRVRFAPEISDEVREMVWHPDQKIETAPDGAAILELPAESVREARRFILAYGRHAAALSHPAHVEALRRESEGLAALYADSSSGAAGIRAAERGKRKKSAGRSRS